MSSLSLSSFAAYNFLMLQLPAKGIKESCTKSTSTSLSMEAKAQFTMGAESQIPSGEKRGPLCARLTSVKSGVFLFIQIFFII